MPQDHEQPLPPEPQDCEPANPNQTPVPRRQDSGQQYG